MSKLTVIHNKETKTAEIRLYGVIGDFWFSDGDPLTAQQFQRELTALEKTHDRINIRINSPGGSVFEGLAMANAIKASRKDVHTYNDGLAASMASVILSAAKDGNRHAAKGSMLMLHSASTIAWGNSTEMRDVADMLDATDETLASFYVDATGKKLADIQSSYFDGKDHWLTAQQAADQGFVKVEDYASEDLPKDISNMNHQQVAALYKEAPANNTTDEALVAKITANPTLMGKLAESFKNFINLKNQTEMKFPKLEALAKIGADKVTDDQVDAVKTELAEAEIEGVTVIKDDALQALEDDRTALTALKTEHETIKNGVTQKDQEITDLKAERDALKAKLDKIPANQGGNAPHKDGDDKPLGGEVKDEYLSETDMEFRKLHGIQ